MNKESIDRIIAHNRRPIAVHQLWAKINGLTLKNAALESELARTKFSSGPKPVEIWAGEDGTRLEFAFNHSRVGHATSRTALVPVNVIKLWVRAAYSSEVQAEVKKYYDNAQ